MIKNIKETNIKVEKIIEFVRQGHSLEQLKKRFDQENFDEIFSIAKAKIKNERIQKLPNNFFFTENDLRFATNQMVADYRAKRLACDTIVDIGCGIGMQSIAFAKTCSKVIAIDIDERKVEYARLNAKIVGVDNIEFHTGDALAFQSRISKADIIFCDPERPSEEVVRNTESLKPNPLDLIKAFSYLTKDFCFEFPPQIREIQLDCELEYVSLSHELNRLEVYLGKLKQDEASAVVLPEGTKLTDKSEENVFAYASPLNFLYEVDGAVEKAGLISRIPGNGLFFYDRYLTSETQVRGDFFKASHKVLRALANYRPEIKEALQKLEAGKIVLHGSIDPKKYYAEKNYFEKGLEGSRTLHLFLVGDGAIICEKI